MSEPIYTSDQRRICRAIKKATGYDVKMHKGGGTVSFYSDDEETGMMLAGLYTSSVDVYRLSDLSIDQWVESFESILEESER